jgi:zinc transporter ZupT
MKAIGEILKEKNLQLDTVNPVLQNGFTQVPNFILKDPNISVGAKVAYAMFLSYAWHNDSCFPGQDRLAEDRVGSHCAMFSAGCHLACSFFRTIPHQFSHSISGFRSAE